MNLGLISESLIFVRLMDAIENSGENKTGQDWIVLPQSMFRCVTNSIITDEECCKPINHEYPVHEDIQKF